MDTLAQETMFGSELQNRHLKPEIMDGADLDEGLHVGALRGLAWANLFTRSAAILWPDLESVLIERPGEK